ncbi:MAG TPA: prolyl oligopeptidase family serine peptidase [Blastocatellia bacterium]|nr:prolyl oligopeptidase family serine peptidase [Blastocatellia bacterium]
MKKLLFATLILAALASFGTLEARAQQAPFVSEMNARTEEMNRLASEKRRAGANLAAFDAIRLRTEDALKRGSIPAVLEIQGEGLALLRGIPWDDKQKFVASLTLDTDRLVVEPNQEIQVSLIRMFPTMIDKMMIAPPTVTLEMIPADTEPGDESQPPRPIVIAKRLAIGETLTNAGRRVLLSDGAYWMVATVETGNQKIAEVRKAVYAISDFSGELARLSAMVASIKSSNDPKVKAVAALVTTPEYQLQRLAPLTKSRGEYNLNPFTELDRIEAVLEALAKGENLLASERGEVERAYRASDGKLVPYRVYVPLSYDGSSARPLAVLLHGALSNERAYFSGLYDPTIIKGEAERRAYIFAAPNGRGDYVKAGQEDVFEVIKAVTRDYRIDAARIYLTGHSMGGFGTWWIASNKPEVFAAIAPVSGAGPAQADQLAAMVAKLKGIPALVIHGARDQIVPADRARSLVAAAQKAGVVVNYVEVPEADHLTIVSGTFPAVIDFFEKNSKQTGAK